MDIFAQATAPTQIYVDRRAGKSTWIVGGFVAALTVLYIAVGGIGGGLMFASLACLVSGLYVVITGRPSWLRLSGRKMGALVAVASVIGALVGGSIAGVTNPRVTQVEQSGANGTSEPSAEAPAASDPAPAAEAAPAPAPPPAAEPPAPAPPAPPAPAPAPVAVAPAPAAPATTSYADCTAVWDALGRSILAGQPGYSLEFDSDGDGVGCESRPKKKK